MKFSRTICSVNSLYWHAEHTPHCAPVQAHLSSLREFCNFSVVTLLSCVGVVFGFCQFLLESRTRVHPNYGSLSMPEIITLRVTTDHFLIHKLLHTIMSSFELLPSESLDQFQECSSMPQATSSHSNPTIKVPAKTSVMTCGGRMLASYPA